MWVLLAMPLTDVEVLGTDKSALAEKPLSEFTGAYLQGIKLFANCLCAES